MPVSFGVVATYFLVTIVLDPATTNSVFASAWFRYFTRHQRGIRRRDLQFCEPRRAFQHVVGNAVWSRKAVISEQVLHDQKFSFKASAGRLILILLILKVPTPNDKLVAVVCPTAPSIVSPQVSPTLSTSSAPPKISGAELPTQEELSQAIGKAPERSDINNRVQAARAMKAALDGLADQKLAQAKSGSSGSRLKTRQTSNQKSFRKNILTTFQRLYFKKPLPKFCAEENVGGQLPTPAEISQVLGQALMKLDLRNRTESAIAVKTALDHIVNDRLHEAKAHKGESQ